MSKVDVIGYYKESGSEDEEKELFYFVAFKNSNTKGETWVEGYNVIDGHFSFKGDAEKYLKTCKKITKDEYKKETSKYITPSEYL